MCITVLVQIVLYFPPCNFMENICLVTCFSYTVSGAYEPLKATKEHETQFHDYPIVSQCLNLIDVIHDALA